MPGPQFSARAPWANPSFSAQTQGRTAMPPVALRLRAVFPPFRHALHPRHTYYLRCLSTRLDLAYFRGHARTSVFGPCAMGEPLVFGPNARPNSHAAPSHTSCPSPTQGIRSSFGVFPHAGTWLFFGRARLRPRCALAVSVRKTGAPLPWVRNLVARRCVEWGEGRIRATRGWISVDRGSKATLPLTMPRRVFKSSAKDSARRPCEIDLRGDRPRLVRRGGLADGTGPSGPKPLLWVGRDGGRWRRLLAWILT